MNVVIEPAAQAELNHSKDYYLMHASLKVATAFVADIKLAIERLRSFPQVGAIASKRLRKLPLQKFPYTLIYHFDYWPSRRSSAVPSIGKGGSNRASEPVEHLWCKAG